MREDEEEARRLREKADSVRTRKRTQAELDALARIQVLSMLRCRFCVLWCTHDVGGCSLPGKYAHERSGRGVVNPRAHSPVF